MTNSSAPADKILGQRELVIMLALLMSLQALAIDGMLPALDAIASELGAGEGNRRQLVVATYLLAGGIDRKSTRLNSSHMSISYAVFCLKKKKIKNKSQVRTK